MNRRLQMLATLYAGTVLVMAGAMPAMAEAAKTAYWTGGGNRANVNDPGNWAITNSFGEAVENGVPDSDTAVVICGETDFNCPFGQTLDYESLTIGDCKLTADCDWRGLVLRSSPAYIDAPKNAYIDTGFKPNQNTRVVMDVTVQGAMEYWCGAWDTTLWNSRAFSFCNDGTGVYTAFVKTGNANNGTKGPVVDNGRHVLDFDKGVFKVDGTTHTDRSAGNETYQWNYSLYLFAQNRKGSATVQASQGTIRFHSCQIYDDGDLVRDYVPTNTGTAFGLHDKVSGTFFASANASVPFSGEMATVEINGTVDLAGHSLNLADTAGTGTITDSSGYLDVPKGYYFDTGFKPNQDTRVVMDVTVQGAIEYWFGCWNSAYNRGAFAVGNDNAEVYVGFGNNGGGKLRPQLPNGRYTIDFDKGVLSTNNAVAVDMGDQTFQVNYNLYLFAQNRNGTAKPHDNQGTIRFHSCQIYTNDILVCDYVPAKSATAFGLYDKVRGAFKAISGSGTGSVGGVVAAGELHIDVCPPVIENTSLEIAGALTLVKDGWGTFRAAKAGQSYVGGTVVSNGLAKSGVGFAPWGSAKSLVTVADGAAFDWAGVHSLESSPYSFAIAGDGPNGTGALLNSVAMHVNGCWQSNCIGDLYLNGDATISACVVFGFTLYETYTSGSYKHTLALNDHTLSIVMRSNNRTISQQFFAFRGVQAINEGKIVFSRAAGDAGITNAPYASFYSAASDLSRVTFELKGDTSANVEQAPTIGTFIDDRSVAGYNLYAERPVVVVGSFKPMTTNLLGTVTLGDATHLSPVLDLSALDGPFVLPASELTLGAAEGATVRVDVGARKVTGKEPIISWTTPPANVSFAWPDGVTDADKGSLVAKDDGLYAVTGFTIFLR